MADSLTNVFEGFITKRNIRAEMVYVLQCRYMVDSARGNYFSALQHLKVLKALDDSINDVNKSKLIQTLQIEYETEKKDQQIKLQGQALSLKEMDPVLKQQNLLLITKQSELQKKDFQQSQAKFLYDSEMKEQSLKMMNYEAQRKDRDLQFQKKSVEFLKREGLLKQASL